ncbi:hypothetical protein [Microvirga guangxiensis]|uniref:Holin-X, holin superfamily III n=1 Tax=Microvirga guangxiensis TaxID=549386 RepID=A0A1G5KD31_9HYPH|nr:hypothetical protein [Microvirga guangxiensis]SCY97970.1 hypothetical protein SAMN02927923_03191 [Microvirga guangxiensis]
MSVDLSSASPDRVTADRVGLSTPSQRDEAQQIRQLGERIEALPRHIDPARRVPPLSSVETEPMPITPVPPQDSRLREELRWMAELSRETIATVRSLPWIIANKDFLLFIGAPTLGLILLGVILTAAFGHFLGSVSLAAAAVAMACSTLLTLVATASVAPPGLDK